MIDAISRFGSLLLLLLTGMKTDLAQMRRVTPPAVSVACAGAAVAFVCGATLEC